MSNNLIETVTGLDAAPALVSLNLGLTVSALSSVYAINQITDNNFLSTLDQAQDLTEQDRIKSRDLRILQRLRILRLSGNKLKYLNVARFPNLRTLYVDNNCSVVGRSVKREQGQKRSSRRLSGLHRLCKLENFSARNQSAASLHDSGMSVTLVSRYLLVF